MLQVVGLPVASCMVVRAPIGSTKEDGSKAWVIRPYTPISRPDEHGHFDLAIKIYEGGKMGEHFNSMRIGDTLDCKGGYLGSGAPTGRGTAHSARFLAAFSSLLALAELLFLLLILDI